MLTDATQQKASNAKMGHPTLFLFLAIGMEEMDRAIAQEPERDSNHNIAKPEPESEAEQ